MLVLKKSVLCRNEYGDPNIQISAHIHLKPELWLMRMSGKTLTQCQILYPRYSLLQALIQLGSRKEAKIFFYFRRVSTPS